MEASDDNVERRPPGPPFILDMRPDGRDGVLVTWSLAGLQRATIRVPASSWIEAEHLNLADALNTFAHSIIGIGDDTDAADDQSEQNGDTDYIGDY